jgi:hypothetical protein
MDVSLKAASGLGMEVNNVDFDVVFARRIHDLADKLRKCIVSLIGAMEGDGREDGVISADRDTTVSDMMLIRALEEVVRGCERECFGSFT